MGKSGVPVRSNCFIRFAVEANLCLHRGLGVTMEHLVLMVGLDREVQREMKETEEHLEPM